MRHPRPTYSSSWIFERAEVPRLVAGLQDADGAPVVNDLARRQDACHARLASRLSPGTDDPEDLPAKLRCWPRPRLSAYRIPRQ